MIGKEPTGGGFETAMAPLYHTVWVELKINHLFCFVATG